MKKSGVKSVLPDPRQEGDRFTVDGDDDLIVVLELLAICARVTALSGRFCSRGDVPRPNDIPVAVSFSAGGRLEVELWAVGR